MFEPLQTSQENSVSGFSESRNLLFVVGIYESGECIDTKDTKVCCFTVPFYKFYKAILI